MRWSIISVAIALATNVAALGINCDGSSNCAGNIGTLDQLHSKVLAIPAGNYYNVGVHIACVNNICAFYQNNNGGTAGDAATHIQNLLNHGCKKCGSDPTQPGNNVNTGELTANWVSSP